ncbi:MAG: ATP-binding protein [Opitutales bacterium]|nr:ATP-binding protein [Opitutales bacterium]
MSIVGVIGLQGSGKTSFAVQYGRKFNSVNGQVYTNMNIHGFTEIRDFGEIPFTRDMKLLIIDEAMFSLDSRSFSSKDNKIFSRFLAYLRKINTQLMWITHFPNLIDSRLRLQTSLFILCKKYRNKTLFNVINAFTLDQYSYSINRSEDFFNYCNYNSFEMPNILSTKKLLTLEEFNKV